MNSFKDFLFAWGSFMLCLILVPLAGYCVAWCMGFVAGAVFGVPICSGAVSYTHLRAHET